MSSFPAPDRLLADSAWLRSLTRHLVGDESAADLEQEVMIAALQREQAVTSRSWLAAVARNLATSLRRREYAERRRVDRLPERQPAPSAAELAAEAELQQRAMAAVLALPISYRDTVLLRFLQGLSLRATAEAMGIPEETVRTRQQRALRMLREQLLPAKKRTGAAGGPSGTALFTAITTWSAVLKAKHIVIAAAVMLLSLLATLAWWQETPTLTPRTLHEPVSTASADFEESLPEAKELAAAAQVDNARTKIAQAAGVTPTTATLRVHLVWEDSRTPAIGLPVLLRPDDQPGIFAMTDSRGEAIFVDIAPGDHRVKTHNWQDNRVELKAGETHTLEFTMARGTAARGIVLDAAKRPVANATILVSAGGISPQFSFPAGTSDAQGEFELAGLRNFALIGARHPEHGTSNFRMLRGDPPDGAAVHLVTLVLPDPRDAPAELVGRVDDGLGNPIVGAWIKVGEFQVPMRPDDNGNLYLAPPATLCTTDNEGRFRADGLRPGSRKLSVYRRGLAPHRQTVNLDAGKQQLVHVILQRGAILTGTVRTAEGQPIANATIESNSSEYPELSSVETDDAGRFHFADLAPGEHSFEAITSDRARERATFVLESGVEQEWDVVLHDRGGIRGRLVDPQGKAIAGWWIGLPTANRRAKSDAEGRFVLPEAAATGNTVLVRSKPGFAPVVARFEDVAAEASERTFVIGPEHAATVRLRGRVLDGDGAPLADAELEITQEGSPVIPEEGAIKSQADGTFAIGPLPPGRYRVSLAHSRWVFAQANVDLERDTELDMGNWQGATSARLTVQLTGTADVVARARVTLVAGERQTKSRGSGSERAFERMFPKHYKLVITVGDHECHRVAVDLAPGADVIRTLDVRDDG